MTNQLCVLCVVKNCYLLITIFPTANMRCAYAGIGMCVDNKSFAIFGAGKRWERKILRNPRSGKV
jgi:hypothetical protein